MEAFDIFKGKVERLLKQYAALDAENKRLRATIEGQNKVIQKLNKKVQSLETNMVSVDLSRAGSGPEEIADMRKQLDNVIGVIDKILDNLDD
jgi:predicted RNase H-like nuclease (RuvC/YqgF family)